MNATDLQQVAALHQRDGNFLLRCHLPLAVHRQQHRRRRRQPQQLLHRLRGMRMRCCLSPDLRDETLLLKIVPH